MSSDTQAPLDGTMHPHPHGAMPAPENRRLNNSQRLTNRGIPVSQTVAEALVDLMVDAGIKHVYGIVGDSANPIVDAMRRHASTIEFVHVRNEEAGAFAAGAEAQVSGRPTAVLGSSGPGASIC